MSQIDTIPLKFCTFDKERRVLRVASEFCGMPRVVAIRSEHTGKTVQFVAIGPEDPLYDEDGWDGEQKIYRPVEPQARVDHLVIYNEY
jgi:hypothetical protein